MKSSNSTIPEETTLPPAGSSPSTHFGFLTVPEDEKVNWVRRHFNTVAYKYDFMNTLLSFGTHYIWKRIAIRMMGLQEGDRVIDVCGGTADLALMAAPFIGSSGRVMLYDINWAMMKTGIPKAAATPYADNIMYIQGDAEKIAFADESFDAAMVGFGIRNLTHMEKGFREMYRVLKPGGKFMCLEFSEPVTPWFRSLYDFYSFYIMPGVGKILGGSRHAYTYLPESIRMFPGPEKLKYILEEIGFKKVTYRRLTNGIAVVHVGRKQ
ncbi:bifunctional demethylmenaquinone methyltransferase/2-methoxy-6-polyprenyl-1,4-benzoquinol methylase UbiE [Desulforhabdus amnigena]|jgi:demethylmenaquinone methyltransferase/2-methoxy-6-polyprenyl-1,4-benzoquinol methylase|uniref:Demethylmenaquinone methyltransferase n=1 Tax=Desulforhabdus amnigena TaxID=40218 RepID=A0A9W6L9B6_9BACT|nr:bifunctional demethylmenaquinone methyltransferase/2-methoxy-6-polyprenyl-1,4-benzoquinol methylase UbiE [Desulforhabdus amnigena]NLJ27154.1 bifunctional demethylmenaquinone methyltransferase/2-methoxy-6-polyprenyl-1,4-benzoquinol methylase UbiE [Deltaproteobacteria bacterium]GLI36372.1 ubiquinone/menaquinone biosynthesis C-methyltransferase UbiE [Desulforhabdus amnigena]